MAKRSSKTAAVRTSVLGVRVQPEQRQQIEEAAIAAGSTVSAYIASVLERAQHAVNTPSTAVNSAPKSLEHSSRPDSLTVSFRLAGKAAVYAPAPDVIMRLKHEARPLMWGRSPDAVEAQPEIAHRRNFMAINKGAYRYVVPRPQSKPSTTPKPDDHPDFLATPLDPAVLYELRRIGNNINQIAHAANASLPPDKKFLVSTFRHLFEVLNDDEGFRRRLTAFRMRQRFNDTAHPQTRSEL